MLRVLLKLGFWVPLILCTYLAFAPTPAESSFEISDVILHAVAFTYLTFALGLAFDPIVWWKNGAWMLAYGVFIEMVQSFEPTRSAEMGDVFVDVTGIALGLLALLLLKRFTLGLLARVLGVKVDPSR